MSGPLQVHCEPDDLFMHVPDALNERYLRDVASRGLDRPIAVRRCQATNLCAGMFGGTACSGATVLHIRLDTEDGPVDLVAKILSPDPVNLYKIDCRFDARISEIRWSKWWGQHEQPWLPRVYDTRCDPARREFWIIREHLPLIGWPDVEVSDWGRFTLAEPRLTRLVEAVAGLHAHSAPHLEELTRLHGGAGVRYGGRCTPHDLVGALDRFIDDGPLFRVIGIGNEERGLVRQYRDAVANRPAWLDAWRILCVTADVKPTNFGFRAADPDQPVHLDFGAARLAPMEEELTLLLGRLKADQALREQVLSIYLDRFAQAGGGRLEVADLLRRLPWAEPMLLLRSLVEQADALRWVPHQDRSKGFIRYFIRAVGKQLALCCR